jgi:chromosome segregation ATPase
MTMNGKDLPPPTRVPQRRLSLKTAIAAASRIDSPVGKPLMNPLGELPASMSGKHQEMEANLLELQADIIIREELLSEKDARLKNRERELNEKDALLEAHRKVVETNSAPQAATNEAPSAINSEERAAFEALKQELDAQEKSLKEAKRVLHEREAFIEQCENELVEKSMLLTEREARVEQKEEDFEAKSFANGDTAQAG